MIRLSEILKNIRESRNLTRKTIDLLKFCVVNGEIHKDIRGKLSSNEDNFSYIELYLHLSVSNACRCLEGFNSKTMEPINYICSRDIQLGSVDICKNNKVVAILDIHTGEILESSNILAEDKCPVDKQLLVCHIKYTTNIPKFERSKLQR